jgi:hypothetical protein
MLEPDLLSRPSTHREKGFHVHYEFHVLDRSTLGGGKITAAPARKPVRKAYILDK